MLKSSEPSAVAQRLGQSSLLFSIMKRNKSRLENTNPTLVAMETRPPSEFGCNERLRGLEKENVSTFLVVLLPSISHE